MIIFQRNMKNPLIQEKNGKLEELNDRENK